MEPFIIIKKNNSAMEERIQKIKEIVESELSCSAHDMEHVVRVYNMCLYLAKGEPDIDLDILKTAAILHDVGRVREDQDNSGSTDHAILGAEMAENILRELGYPEERVKIVKNCIITHRFRSGNKPQTKEAEILFDADKLDVTGAVGIARSFIIAGQYGEKMFVDVSVDEYVKDNLLGEKTDGRIKVISKHAPNLEFETKFRHIPDKLYRQRGKRIAKQRLEFMGRFFERLKKEIKGEI